MFCSFETFRLLKRLNLQFRQKEISFVNDLFTLRRKEQSRIGRDFHDGIGPTLAGIKLVLNSLSQELAPEDFRFRMSKISGEIDAAIQTVRTSARELSAGQVLRQGLVNSIEEYGSRVNEFTGIKFLSAYQINEDKVEETVLINLHHVLCELITNSIRHSDCDEVRVAINTYTKFLYVLYYDNGDNWKKNRSNTGIGLESIKTRIQSMEGQLDLTPDLTNGFFLTIKIMNKNYLKYHENSFAATQPDLSFNCG